MPRMTILAFKSVCLRAGDSPPLFFSTPWAPLNPCKRGGDPPDCSLVNVTYLTADDAGDGTGNGDGNEADTAYGTGRHWGVFNRKKLPLAEQETIRIPAGPWLKAFRTDAGTIYPPAADENGFGFTLFVENAAEWLDRASTLEQGDEA